MEKFELVFRLTVHLYCLVFIVCKGLYMLPEEKNNYQCHPDTNPASYRSDLPANYTHWYNNSSTHVMGVPKHIFIGFKARSLRWKPYLIVTMRTRT